MSEIILTYEKSWHAEARSASGGDGVAMDAPAGCSGGAEAENLTPIELFASSYAGCVVMSMDIAARKHGFNVEGAEARVSVAVVKERAMRIERVDATVALSGPYTEEQIELLHRAGHSCPIHGALRPEVETSLAVEVA